MSLHFRHLPSLWLAAHALSGAPALAEAAPASEGKPPPAPEPVAAGDWEFKPGKGITTTSEDGDFQLTLRPRAQFLYALTDDHFAGGRAQQSLEVRRFRLQLGGTAFGKHNHYLLELGLGGREDELTGKDTSRLAATDGALSMSPVLDAYAEFDHCRDLTLRIGQYKVPFGRQRVMSEGNFQFVDASLATREFTFDRDIGIDLRSRDFLGLDLLKYTAGVYTGQGRNTYAKSEFHMLYLARVEVLPLGLFEDYQEGDFERGSGRLAVGGSVGYQQGALRDRGSLGSVPADGGLTDLTVAEGDVMFKMEGLSVSTELFFRKGVRAAGALLGTTDGTGKVVGLSASRDGVGWYGQAGYLLPQIPVEFAARYGVIRGKDGREHDALADGKVDPAKGQFQNELGLAASYYFARHPLKVQADFFRLYENGRMGEGTNQLRVQLQIAL
jgi:hypothetical protein